MSLLQTEILPTEYTRGSIAGADFGSRARVVLRSPEAFMFVALGVHMVPRKHTGYHDIKRVCEKASLENFSKPEVRARIVAFFGKGADEAVLRTLEKRGHATVLFQGGGVRLPLPDQQAREVKAKRYAEVSPDRDLHPESAKGCIQCGKKLTLRTDHHRLDSDPLVDPNHPKSLDDLQRLTNTPIVSVSGYGQQHAETWWPFVSWFATWDGESYLDDTFCSDRCAAVYGRRAAEELEPLPEGGEAPKRQWRARDDVRHYDEEAQAERHRIDLEKMFGKTGNVKLLS